MRFRQTVIETREVECLYEVEADSLEEANEKIENGETIKERELSFESSVVDRKPQGTVRMIEDDPNISP